MADVEQLIADGLEHYLNGRLELAATAFHEALRLDPTHLQARDFLEATLGGPTTVPDADAFAPLDIENITAWDEGPQVKTPIVIADDPSSTPAPALELVTQRHTARTERISATQRRKIDSLIEEARRFESLGDYTSVLDVTERILAVDPQHTDASALRERAATTLLQMYESRLGSRDGIPEVVMKPDEVIWLGLDHRAGFVLAQIDGVVNYDDLYAVCGMEPVDTARVLAQLLEQKVIRTKPRSSLRPRLR